MAWVNSLTEEELDAQDEYEISNVGFRLAVNWDSHTRASYSSWIEADLRQGVDSMVSAALSLGGHLFQYEYFLSLFHASSANSLRRTEVTLFLPAAPWVATADAIAYMGLPTSWIRFLRSFGVTYVFAAAERNSYMMVPTFLVEYKVNPSHGDYVTRQLTLDLCSAQRQRRALGLDDMPVFGATLVGRDFTIFISEWNADGKVVSACLSVHEWTAYAVARWSTARGLPSI